VKYLIWYLAGINLLAYVVYWLDKRRAEKGQRRIAERELLLWAAAGGSLGAFLAMRRFRHKTQKASFRIAFFAIIAVQVVVIYLVLTR